MAIIIMSKIKKKQNISYYKIYLVMMAERDHLHLRLSFVFNDISLKFNIPILVTNLISNVQCGTLLPTFFYMF